jgi:sugar phosphate isomerase/epimerase
MVRAISSYIYVKERLHPGMLDSLSRAGAEAIEIFAARSHFDYNDRQHVREIAGWFQSSGLALNSIHSPMFSDLEWGRAGTPPINIADREKKRRIESMDEIKRALEVAELVPFRYLIQHIGVSNESDDPAKFEAAMTSIEHLHAFARPLGVRLLLENIPNDLSTPEKLVEMLHTLHIPDLGVCFDTGHAHIMSSVPDAFHMLKDHIRSTHVHDNNKQKDEHLWPGNGSIDWPETVRLLRSAPNMPPILIEINAGEDLNIVEKCRQTFKKLEQSEHVAAG